jgi:hypothetical protein
MLSTTYRNSLVTRVPELDRGRFGLYREGWRSLAAGLRKVEPGDLFAVDPEVAAEVGVDNDDVRVG